MTIHCKLCGSTKIRYFSAVKPEERFYCRNCRQYTSITRLNSPLTCKECKGESIVYHGFVDPKGGFFCKTCNKYVSIISKSSDPPFGGRMTQQDSVQVKLG